jgi:RNA polymerase sigma-70 factor (ECF subfamily)
MILRKKRRIRETPVDFQSSDKSMGRQWDVADIAANPEEYCLSKDMTLTVDRAIHCLPLRLRAVAELRLVHDLALHEIAANLNISIPAAKSRLYRAKRRIVRNLHRTAKARHPGKRD